MKLIWKEVLACLMMGLMLPGTMLKMTAGDQADLMPALRETEAVVSPMAEPLKGNPQIPVRLPDGTVTRMDMEEYLVGVVLAEMPASFEGEALKAQAVAARTYAGKAHLRGGKHGDGSICTDSHCCQAYISEVGYLGSGGTELGIEKVRGAVYATRGQVLTYGGELIEATYFSCSGGSTEDAKAVWGAEFPYLKAVESPGEEGAEYFKDTVIIPRERAEMLLGMDLPENPAEWLGTVNRTPGSGVSTMEIGGRVFKGTELRTLLGLRSTAMEVQADDRGLVIETRGWGHRVGMSQYGADAMAVNGSTYEQILLHYYKGTELSQYVPPEGEAQPMEFTEDSQPTVANETK